MLSLFWMVNKNKTKPRKRLEGRELVGCITYSTGKNIEVCTTLVAQFKSVVCVLWPGETNQTRVVQYTTRKKIDEKLKNKLGKKNVK
jgi:hypothetical protein